MSFMQSSNEQIPVFIVQLVNSIVSSFVRKRLKEIHAYWQDPIGLQQNVFVELIKRAEDTSWGKSYQYNSISKIEDLKNRLPVQSYEDFKPFINRILKGENNVTWPDKIDWFAKSSGTSSDKSKFIPLSFESMKKCHYRAGRDVMGFYYRNYPASQVFTGKGIILGGSHEITSMESGKRSGDLSAILLQNLSPLARFLTSVDLKISLMDEWEEKILKLSEQYIPRDVTSLSGVPSWSLVLLKKVLELTGKTSISEVWPNFELYIHGGVSFEPYRDCFQQMIGSEKLNCVETYNASEGFFGIQDQPNSRELLLMLDYGIYYEFIPLAEIENENPETLSLEEVELDKDYALVISTNSGLWRYNLGDTIKFTNLAPFRFMISGRTKHFINVFGEELMIHNTDKALAETCEALQLKPIEYTVAPIFMDQQNKGGHEWLIEFERNPSDIKTFALLLDQNLKRINSDYEAKRYRDIALALPVIQLGRSNVFYDWLKQKGRLGGQHKIPRLSNERIFIEEILKFNFEET